MDYDSEREEFEFYSRYRRHLHINQWNAFKSIDSWLLTLSGGAIAISLPSAIQLSADRVVDTLFTLYCAWTFLTLAIVSAFVSKCIAYCLLKETLENLEREAAKGWALLQERFSKVSPKRTDMWHAIFYLDVASALCFVIGIVFLFVFLAGAIDGYRQVRVL